MIPQPAPVPAPPLAPALALTLDLRGWLYLTGLSVLWGGSFFFAEIAVEVLPPLLLVFLRVLIAALTLHVVLFASGRRSPLFDQRFPALLFLGLINNVVPFSLIFWAQVTLASGIAAVINGMTPIFTMLLAAVLTTDEKLSAAKVAGILVGFGGVAVMVGVGALQGAEHHVLPALALVAAAVAYALSAIFARRLTGFDPLEIAAGQLTGSTLIMAVLFALGLASGAASLDGIALPDAHVVAAVLALGVFSTAFAYLLYFALIRNAGATNASLVTYLVPVTAILLGVLVLGERFAVHEIFGMAMVVVGVALAQGSLRLGRRRRPRRSRPGLDATSR